MTVIWIILEVIFLFCFFKLPLVDDTVKSKYEEYLEYKSRQQQQGQNDEQQEVDKKDVNVNQSVNEQSSIVDPSLSVATGQEKMPLLPNDSMKDLPAASHNNITLPPQNFCRRIFWLSNG